MKKATFTGNKHAYSHEFDLDAIKERVAAVAPEQGIVVTDLAREVALHDAPALIAEVERLRAVVWHIANYCDLSVKETERFLGGEYA